jgi:glycosyltransferase involved in cell wall biosynthesis
VKNTENNVASRNILVSVIIPIYNIEKYLAQCLDSVLSQTYKNLEIILVNDASTDGSLAICQKYAARNNRIKILNKKTNAGQSLARRDGVKKARAEYVCFVDGDDVISDSYVADLLGSILKYKTEIAACCVARFTGDGSPNSDVIKKYDKNTSSLVGDLMSHFADHYVIGDPPSWIIQSMHSKIFRKYLFDNINYDLIQSNILEDNLVSAQIIAALKKDKMAVVNKTDYFYRTNPKSAMNNKIYDGVKLKNGKVINFIELVNLVADGITKIFDGNFNGDAPGMIFRHSEYNGIIDNLKIAERRISEQEQTIADMSNDLADLGRSIENDKLQIAKLQNNLNNILHSKSYRLAMPIRLISTMLRRLASSYYGHSIKYFLRLLKSKKRYFIKQLDDSIKTSDLAVVVHLYYFDTWKFISKKLDLLSKQAKFDLFITLPLSNEKYISIIRKRYPSAKFYVVPNLGRDVLPFLKVCGILKKRDYKVVLKIHSKKSLHRSNEDGAESGERWLHNTLDALVPDDVEILRKILRCVQNGNTGIVGAKKYYCQATVGVGGDFARMNYVLRKCYGKSIARRVMSQNNLRQKGFFAGTMFWCNLECVGDLTRFSQQYFELESGQVSGTMAHAMERLFTLLPEISHKTIYGCSDDAVAKLDYKTDNIPKWFKPDGEKNV